MIEVLHKMNNVMESWDFVFNVLGALGSAATFGAFIFLFRRDKDKQKQIDNLSIVADSLNEMNKAEQLKLKTVLRPEVKCIKVVPDVSTNEITVTIKAFNNEAKEVGLGFGFDDDYIQMKLEYTEVDLEVNEPVNYILKYCGEEPMKDYSFDIHLQYCDILGNPYYKKILITGDKFKEMIKEERMF
ncbi:hypothetical protein ACE1ET_00785 [Saccharicrinis sp. FJH62]|uniref:hypothetical protein n=1 Tax=Saccharicrinis sp. FJH62 TaxID=3344657 RepID=UPI0035D40B59